MGHQKSKKLFTTVASGIQGRWYNFATDEILIFSPTEAPLEVSDVLIIKDGVAHSDHYLLGFCATGEIYALIGDERRISNATVKIITEDSLILQQPDCKMLIYERRKDTSFADDLIAAL
ncbi:MAG: hypothetical protein M3R72_05505 [Bacteroidota bacterium]|nr:hypothetical protein [Bacteroidota bacterium]